MTLHWGISSTGNNSTAIDSGSFTWTGHPFGLTQYFGVTSSALALQPVGTYTFAAQFMHNNASNSNTTNYQYLDYAFVNFSVVNASGLIWSFPIRDLRY